MRCPGAEAGRARGRRRAGRVGDVGANTGQGPGSLNQVGAGTGQAAGLNKVRAVAGQGPEGHPVPPALTTADDRNVTGVRTKDAGNERALMDVWDVMDVHREHRTCTGGVR